ncbi:MAG: DUF3108 domain-containing protein [Parahaliea sp.]
MAKKSRRQASPFNPANTRSGVGALLMGALLILSPLYVQASVEPELKPYTAQYDTSARGMHVTLKRELKSDGKGGYTLTNGGKILVVGFHEVAVFRVDGEEMIPKSYVYQGTGLINRRREVHFTPGSDTVRSLYKGEWYELPNKTGTLDRLSQQEHLRLLLLTAPNPKDDKVITVADGRKVKQYRISYVGEEILDTPLGLVRTLHFERRHDDPNRKSEMWVAPDWDYLMVKTIHVEDGDPVEVTLTRASIDGQLVRGQNKDSKGKVADSR